jgi:hypothetical protein
MKNIERVSIWAASLTCASLLQIGCGKSTDQLDPKWTSPVAVSSSLGGLGGAIVPHKFQDTLIGVEVLHGGAANLYFLNRDANSWFQSHVAGTPDAGGWCYLWGAAAIDPQTEKVLLPQGYAENEKLVMKVLLGTITERGALRDSTERTWLTDKETLLGEIGPNVKLNFPPVRPDRPNRSGAILGRGMFDGSGMFIPYSFSANTYKPPNTYATGPFSAGVFQSADSGKTWQMERVSDQRAGYPILCQTAGYIYYFAGSYPLWFSRKAIGAAAVWGAAHPITKTSTGVNGIFDVAGEGDTAHICWMDRRHNKWRFNIDAPPVENNEIYYRRRKDADSDWSKEIPLSKGLLYAYAPTISAEGDKVVVVWAGIRTADKWHTDMAPNDIYYVTSKDGGKTWTDPLKVTDGAKDGLTAGMPQVALLNGTIHLFYTQGKRAESKELSPGLTKLGNEPWPIYYTHRPFPN